MNSDKQFWTLINSCELLWTRINSCELWQTGLKWDNRAGNSLIWFPSKSLIFCPKMSEWAIRSKKLAIHSFAHFWWAKWAIRSHRSFDLSKMSNSLTSLTKKEKWVKMSDSLIFKFFFFLSYIKHTKTRF